MIALPPGDPTASSNAPSRNTRVGDIEERGFLPGATALAMASPRSSTGRKLKSVSWLLRKKPATKRWDPNSDSTVVVIETTLPMRSTTTKWLVPGTSAVASRPRAGAPGGSPASTTAIARDGDTSAARERRYSLSVSPASGTATKRSSATNLSRSA
jgi:hypothetical protein